MSVMIWQAGESLLRRAHHIGGESRISVMFSVRSCVSERSAAKGSSGRYS